MWAKFITNTITWPIIIIFSLSAIISLTSKAIADEELILIATISHDLDSAFVTSVTPVGDFNADGYGDLLIGVGQDLLYAFEAAFLFFGGPDFDTEPDLIFIGDPQSEELCIPGEHTGFGSRACRLNDFNGDGIDDIAIAAPGLCNNYMYDGRIYIYFGSPNPDTSVDMLIDEGRYRDILGGIMVVGDFNGDNLGDLLAPGLSPWYGPRVLIFLGCDPPSDHYDWIYDYSGQIVDIDECYGDFDINGDNRDEFGWYIESQYGDSILIFLGNDTLNNEPSLIMFPYVYFIRDISYDFFDDFMKSFDDGWYLCLGTDSLDTDPDYYMWPLQHFFPFTYNLNGTGLMLIKDNWDENKFVLYNTGIPFDTTSHGTIDYCQSRKLYNPVIGDINADGVDDLAIRYAADTLRSKVFIYSIIETDIDQNELRSTLPHEHEFLHCYPNPFNTTMILTLDGFKGGDAYLNLYDITGRLVKTLNIDKNGKTTWDATDNFGQKVSSGLYFAKAETMRGARTARVVFLK